MIKDKGKIMLKKVVPYLLIFFAIPVYAGISVKTIDFLKTAGMTINAGGPLLIQTDSVRNRIILANTLTSSISIIDGQTHAVSNIPINGRIFQHLKSEAMTINKRTGEIYVIGRKCFHIVSPDKNISKTIKTKVQFESIAVDENTGNVFVAGRQSKKLGLYNVKKKKLKMHKWLDSSSKRMLDVYCGIGGIGIYLSRFCGFVWGIELYKELIDAARANASLNRADNISFVLGDARKVLVQSASIKGLIDAVVVNPPRSGLSKKVVKRILQIEAPAIVYSSRNPITFIENIKQVSYMNIGYKLEHLEVFDFFPHTPHMEVVGVLKRQM